MSEFRVEIKVKNAVLYNAITELGLSIPKFCKKYGFTYDIVIKYINFKKSPIACDGGWLESAEKLSDFLGIGLEELFPEAIRELKVENNKFVRDMSSKVALEMASNPEMLIGKQEYEEKIVNHIFENTTSRDAKMLKDRFFNDKTLMEVSSCSGISPERARQIEQMAMWRVKKYIKRGLPEDLKDAR